MLKVLGRVTSINVRKVLWTLDELGLAYEREDWGLPVRNPYVPEFLKFNPNAQVPVVIDGDFVLWESNVIMRYLEEKDGARRLLAADLETRTRAEQWLQWQATELNPQWGYAVYALLRKVPGYDDPMEIRRSLARWGDKMKMLEARLVETGAFAAGDAFSLADIALGLSIHRWYAVPGDLPALPAVRRYYETLRRRDAGARYMSAEVF
jgi:glutathione S-transferase